MARSPATGPSIPAGSAHRRPRNRKALILDAAARAFAERGYHPVGMEDIAIAVGISGPALYRHFPSKYALFAQCARSQARELLDDWAPPPVGVDLSSDPAAARAYLDDMLAALVRTTVRNRRTGAIYRWEGRYLEPPDRQEIGQLFQEMVARVAAVVRVLRPELDDADLDLISAGVLSVVASLTAHGTVLAQRRIATVIPAAAVRVALGEASDARDGEDPPWVAPPAEPTSRRDLVLESAVRLFHSEGFADVTVDAIAGAAGLTPSGLYRHFASKSDVLLAACLLANEHLESAVERANVRGVAPTPALRRLSRAYVAHSFTHRELMQVYYSDVGALPAPDRARLRALQREHVELWTGLLGRARPELDPVEVTFLVHAAIGLVTDLGRRLQWSDAPGNQERVHALVLRALGLD